MIFSMMNKPLPHQLPAIAHVKRPRVSGLFMDMGTGKTFVSISLVHLRQQRVNRVLIYCPVSLKETWYEEILKHTDTRPSCIHVFDDKTSIRTMPHDAFWYIIGIESVSGSDRVALAAHHLTTTRTFVIVDESSYIKGHNALRTRRITRYSENARYRLALTGTPISQGVQDLYAQMKFLSPKILGYNSFYSFAANHLEYSEKYPGMVIRAHNTAWLAAKIRPYVYQITKEEAGLNLPPKLYDSRYFLLTDEQDEAYEQAKWDILMSADEIDSYVIFQLFGVLQQIVSGFWNRDGKLIEFDHGRTDTLLDVVEMMQRGNVQQKVIIWCKFRYSIRQVTEALAGEYGRDAVANYYGDLNEAERAAELARFRHEAAFFVASMQTGGHGLTLNESHHTIFYENEFKYAHRLQAEDRNHRIGQEKRPLYTDIWAQCGIERRIADSMAKKGNVVEDFRRDVNRLKNLKGADLKQAISKML